MSRKRTIFSSEKSYSELSPLIEEHDGLISYKWLKIALKYFGTTEIAKSKSDPLIVQFIASTTGKTYRAKTKQGTFIEINSKTDLPLICSIGYKFNRLTKRGKRGARLNEETTHWCSAFVNHVMLNSGYDVTNSLAARSWHRWGKRIKKKDRKEYLGAIAVFTRPDKDNPNAGHVGFYVGETKYHYLILGGNQNNSVCVKKYRKKRLLSFRWPA